MTLRSLQYIDLLRGKYRDTLLDFNTHNIMPYSIKSRLWTIELLPDIDDASFIGTTPLSS